METAQALRQRAIEAANLLTPKNTNYHNMKI